MGVSSAVGQTRLKRTVYGSSSARRVWVSPTTACSEEQYDAYPKMPKNPAMELMLTILTPPFFLKKQKLAASTFMATACSLDCVRVGELGAKKLEEAFDKSQDAI